MASDKSARAEVGREPDPARPGGGKRKRTRTIAGLLVVGAIALVLVGVSIGYLIAGRRTAPSSESASSDAVVTTWTCSMHPQIKLPGPGKCPICFMDLIPLTDALGDDENPRQLTMSEAAQALAEIETVPVRRQYVSKPVRMVGKVDYDETRLIDIAARVPGRLDRLFVDYTGITVRKGEHLVSMYSPELIVAQRELLQTWQAYQAASAGRDRQLAETTLKMAQEKLRLLGVLPEQIDAIQRRGTTSDHLTIYAPQGGIVIRKYVNEGVYVETGTKIYTIADLHSAWVYLDAYESDVSWLRYGQAVQLTAESDPGEVFRGRIALIDPVLNETTRTVKVRVNVPNEDLRLKPGMFVRAIVTSRLAVGGRVLDASLAGKWICSMHPEVVKDGPGKCDECGMDLVPAEQLGPIAGRDDPEPPLVIPASAPLVTGKRAVVYVKVAGRKRPTFEGREVVLGHRAGDFYLVEDGLKEGELVVTSGGFKIDADLQLKARPSMMGPTSPTPLDVPQSFREQLGAVYEPYLRLQTALADDRLDDARTHWAEMREALETISTATIPTETIDPRLGETWQQTRGELAGHLTLDAQQAGIDVLRVPFEDLARSMLLTAEVFGHASSSPLYEAFCPMAFDNRGAPWLQAGETVDNPYFGHKMKRCGTIRRRFAPSAGGPAQPRQPTATAKEGQP